LVKVSPARLVGLQTRRECFMTSILRVSIVICTRNRVTSLSETLAALRRLEEPADAMLEAVIVDSASTDGTEMAVQDFTRSAGFPIRYVREERPGLSLARNRGIQEARGEILLFTDDDCLPEPTWVTAALHELGGNPVQVIGGRVELHDPNDLPMTIKTSLMHERFETWTNPFGFAHGCNMIVGRGVLARIGLFDIRLGAGTVLGAGEDADFFYRAFKAGIPVRYAPGPMVFHHHGRRRPEEGERLMRGYLLGAGALAMKFLLRRDMLPAKHCWWQIRSALRQWRAGQTRFSRVLLEGRTLVGGIRFLCGPAFRAAGGSRFRH
jgi:GT2 family glycosyltransferase